MSNPLTDFLLARIAERESVARDMQDQARRGRPFFDTDSLAGGTGIRELINPDRVLAECRAKRRIVADLSQVPVEDFTDGVHPQAQWAAARTLLNLAAVDADHPDFKAEWV